MRAFRILCDLGYVSHTISSHLANLAKPGNNYLGSLEDGRHEIDLLCSLTLVLMIDAEGIGSGIRLVRVQLFG